MRPYMASSAILPTMNLVDSLLLFHKDCPPHVWTSPHPHADHQIFSGTLKICSTGMTMSADTDHVLSCREHINTIQAFLCCPSNFLSIIVSLSATLFMNTRKKNKSTHPGVPDMTPSQLSSSGLSRIPAARSKKGPTKDQQIAALKDELKTLRELISSVSCLNFDSSLEYHNALINPFISCRTVQTCVQEVTIRCKLHKVRVATLNPQPIRRRSRPLQGAQSARPLVRLARHRSGYFNRSPCFHFNSISRLRRMRAIDPFESSSMAHAGATGLVDDWRTKIASPVYRTTSPLQTPDYDTSLLSPTSSTTKVSVASTRGPFSAYVRITSITLHLLTYGP
jgi:hypothetical protein